MRSLIRPPQPLTRDARVLLPVGPGVRTGARRRWGGGLLLGFGFDITTPKQSAAQKLNSYCELFAKVQVEITYIGISIGMSYPVLHGIYLASATYEIE